MPDGISSTVIASASVLRDTGGVIVIPCASIAREVSVAMCACVMVIIHYHPAQKWR